MAKFRQIWSHCFQASLNTLALVFSSLYRIHLGTLCIISILPPSSFFLSLSFFNCYFNLRVSIILFLIFTLIRSSQSATRQPRGWSVPPRCSSRWWRSRGQRGPKPLMSRTPSSTELTASCCQERRPRVTTHWRYRKRLIISFLKNGPTLAPFLFILGLFQTNSTSFYNKSMWKISWPSSIWRWDLNPQPLELESSPITNTPEIPSSSFLFCNWK